MANFSDLRYWAMNGGRGPSEGAALLADGTLVTVSLTHEGLRPLLGADIVATFTKAPTGGWSGDMKAKNPFGVAISLYSGSHGDDLPAAVRALKARMDANQAECDRLANDPVAMLDARLKAHDWWAMMSDSSGVARAGERDMKEIESLLGDMADKELAAQIWAKHAPKEFPFPVSML